MSFTKLLLLSEFFLAFFSLYDFSHSVAPDSLGPHGLQRSRLLSPWYFLGKNIGVGCHFRLQGIVLTQGSNPCLLHCRWILYHLSHLGSPSFPYSPLWDSTSQEEEGQDHGHQLHGHQTRMLSRLMTGVAVLKLCKRKIKQDLHEDIKPLLIPKTGGGGWISS